MQQRRASVTVFGILNITFAALMLVCTLIASAVTGSVATTNEIKQLVTNLGDDSFATRESAQKQLLAIGAPAVTLLKNVANSKDPEIRIRALEILAEIGEGDLDKPDAKILTEVATLLEPIHASNDPNLDVLVQMGKRATPSLVTIINRSDNNQKNAIYAMIALTRIADPRSFPTLAGLFQSGIATHLPGYIHRIQNPAMLRELIQAWIRLGADASVQLREQVKMMSKQDCGDDPAAYLKWFEANHPADNTAQ